MANPYPIIEVQPEWVVEPEGMGSKRKFWYRQTEESAAWLFKYPLVIMRTGGYCGSGRVNAGRVS